MVRARERGALACRNVNDATGNDAPRAHMPVADRLSTRSRQDIGLSDVLVFAASQRQSAIAIECATTPHRFREFADQLFRLQDSIGLTKRISQLRMERSVLSLVGDFPKGLNIRKVLQPCRRSPVCRQGLATNHRNDNRTHT